MQSFIRKVGSKMENSSGLETKSTRSRYMTSELVDFDIKVWLHRKCTWKYEIPRAFGQRPYHCNVADSLMNGNTVIHGY